MVLVLFTHLPWKWCQPCWFGSPDAFSISAGPNVVLFSVELSANPQLFLTWPPLSNNTAPFSSQSPLGIQFDELFKDKLYQTIMKMRFLRQIRSACKMLVSLYLKTNQSSSCIVNDEQMKNWLKGDFSTGKNMITMYSSVLRPSGLVEKKMWKPLCRKWLRSYK